MTEVGSERKRERWEETLWRTLGGKKRTKVNTRATERERGGEEGMRRKREKQREIDYPSTAWHSSRKAVAGGGGEGNDRAKSTMWVVSNGMYYESEKERLPGEREETPLLPAMGTGIKNKHRREKVKVLGWGNVRWSEESAYGCFVVVQGERQRTS